MKLKRAESREMHHEDVTAVVWQDKRVVLLLSTNSDARTDGSVTRKNRKRQWRKWNCMSSRHHKLHETYGRCGCKWSVMRVLWCRPILKKWWKFILHFVLNVCLAKCFILYDPTNHPPLQHTETGNWPSDETWCVSWLVHHVSQAYRQEIEFCLSELFFVTFSILYEKYQAVQKCVLCL